MTQVEQELAILNQRLGALEYSMACGAQEKIKLMEEISNRHTTLRAKPTEAPVLDTPTQVEEPKTETGEQQNA